MNGTTGGLLDHLARFAGVLRDHRIDVGIGDEVDAARALALVDLFDRADVHRALRITFKIRPRDAAVFDTLFQEFWTVDPSRRRIIESVSRRGTNGALPRGRAGSNNDRPPARESRQRPTT